MSAEETRPEKEGLDIAEIRIDQQRAIEMFRKQLSRGSAYTRLKVGLREAFQNALNATYRAGFGPGRNRIEIYTDGEDVVLRDHGIGLRPEEIQSLILTIFSKPPENGISGFGAGTVSVIFGADATTLKSRQDGNGLVEFRSEQLGRERPRLGTDAEAEVFGVGTEVRFCGVLHPTDQYLSGRLYASSINDIVNELYATSMIPPEIEVYYQGGRLMPAMSLGAASRRPAESADETFAGALVEHHIWPLDEDETKRPDALRKPESLVQLADPSGRGIALTQWSEYLEQDAGFVHVVRIRPTVPPDHPEYPFNPERNSIASTDLRESINRVRSSFVRDRLSVIRQETWKTILYEGGDSHGPGDVAQAMKEEILDSGGAERMRRVAEIILEADGAIAALASLAGARAGEDVALKGEIERVAESLVDAPALVMTHKEWARKDWQKRNFSPTDPTQVKKLAPVLAAVRMIGMVIRKGALDLGANFRGKGPDYGFVFREKKAGLFAPTEMPSGDTRNFVLINPECPDFRLAETPEQLCDMIADIVAHEISHEQEKVHDEGFSSLYGSLNRRSLARQRAQIYKAFRESGAWKAMREFQGLPVRPVKEKPAETLRVLGWEEARELADRIGTDSWKVRDLAGWMTYLAEDAKDRRGAADAVRSVLSFVRDSGEVAADFGLLENLAARLGITMTGRSAPMTDRSEESLEAEARGLREILADSYACDMVECAGVTNEKIDRYDLPERCAKLAYSPAELALMGWRAEHVSSYCYTGDPLKAAASVREQLQRTPEAGSTKEALAKLIEDAYEQVTWMGDPRPAMPVDEAMALIMAALQISARRNPDHINGGAEAVAIYKPALKALLETGRLGRIARSGPQKKATQRSLF